MFRLTVIALFFLSSLAFSDPDITNCAAGGLFTSGGVAECVSPKFTEPVVTDLCRANVHGYVYYSGECLEAGGEWDAARNICLFADPARTGEERAQAEEGLIKSAHNECGSQVQELNSEWVTLPSNAWCNTTKLRYMVNGEVLHGAKDFHISVNYYPTYAPNPPQPSDCTGLDNQTLRVQLDRTEACPIGYNRREQTDPQNTENKLVECWKMPEEKPSNSNNEPASPGEGDDEDETTRP